jgi:hypothetical protein
MSVLIALIIAAIFGLWGYHKRLYPSWAFLFNVLVASYLAIVLTPVFLNIKQAGGILALLGPWANAAIMLVIFAIYLALSQLLSSFYLTNTYCVSFPRFIDDFGGALLAFAGGYVIVNILLFALAVTPLNNHPITKKYIPDNDGRAIVKASSYISGFSLQFDNNLSKAVEKIKTLPVVANKTTNKPAEKSQKNPPIKKEPAKPVITQNTPAEPNKIQDTNIIPDNPNITNKIMYAVNPNIQTEPNRFSAPATKGVLDVNVQKNNPVAESNSVTAPPDNRD